MKKKTYKKMQNRLYREIKRRIIVENMFFRTPIECVVSERKIDTIKVCHAFRSPSCYGIHENFKPYEEFAKQTMADKIADKLLSDNYITFMQGEEPGMPISDYFRIEARLDVVKPVN